MARLANLGTRGIHRTLESLRKKYDKNPSRNLRDQIDELIWKAQRSGKIGTIEYGEDPEEDQ